MKAMVFLSWMSVFGKRKSFWSAGALDRVTLYPLFLFELLTEALSPLVRNATNIGEYSAFSVEGKYNVDILQFADDTLFFGEGSWRQVWALKSVLRGFEVV